MRLISYITALTLWGVKAAVACPPDWWFDDAVNNTEVTLDKRYFLIAQAGGRTYWSPRVVNYCFDPSVKSSDKTTLSGWLTGGWQKWQAAGGDQLSHLTFQPGNAAVCADPNTATLTISTNKQNDMQTMGLSGGSMSIDISAVQRHPLPGESVLAHEIGHVWGLQHEHQRPDALGSPTGTNPNPRWVFDCKALADWAKAGSPDYNDPKCTSRKAAMAAGFSAMQFLPYQFDFIITPSPYGGDVDYESIMNYGGQYISKLDNTPGKSSSGRAIVLYDKTTSLDGTGIGTGPYIPRKNPSAGDVAALRRMYPVTGNTGGGSCPAGSKVKRDGVCGGFEYVTEIADCYVAAVATNTVVK